MLHRLHATFLTLCFLLGSTASAQALLLGPKGPVRVPVSANGDGLLHATIQKVVDGPDARELTLGLGTAIPDRTRLLAASFQGTTATITLGRRFVLIARKPQQLELALEQLNKSAIHAIPAVRDIRIRVQRLDGAIESLEAMLERALPGATGGTSSASGTTSAQGPTSSALTGTGDINLQGALTGQTIAISPGHGYYWHTSLGWTTQRGNIGGLTEDIHTNEIAMRFLIPYLENMGAHVISCRERGEVATQDAVVDNDTGAPGYADSGFVQSAGSGYNGGGYRFATTASIASASATWNVQIASSGLHPVYAWYRASSNRTTDARYEITHSGGVDTISIDQSRDSLTWVFLGTFHFEAGAAGVVTLSNESSDLASVVVADAIRIGAGTGSIVRGGTSGRPRWQEASRYWAQFTGAPTSVYDTAGTDNADDVTCRPRFAEWRSADAFISLHTNAGGGTGTSSFVYNGGATAGSTTLQNRVHTQLVQDIRANYDASWVDRGQMTANFGEVRLLSTMPGMLIELAFHDTPNSDDHDALHDPEFRRIGGRAIARGILRYFVPGSAFAPEPPLFYSVLNESGGLAVRWAATAGATSYTIEQSENGKGFATVATTASTTWNTGPLPFGSTVSFRVRAHNAVGRSFPTEVLTAGTSHKPTPELLLVQGFDRLGRTVKSPDNTFDYLALHADAIRRNEEFSLAFDAATNDSIRIGLVNLANYRAVDWACGEESTADSTFDVVEQGRVIAYLAGGGRLLVSGSEIGWDLEANGTPTDRAFYHNQLGADFVSDDANSYAFRGRAGGIFAGITFAAFDNGVTGTTYDVDFPDVIQPFDANSTLTLEYGNFLGAGIERIVGDSRVVTLGFPIETIVDPDVRTAVMARALRFLLDGRALEVPAMVTLGATAPFSVRIPAEAGDVYALGAALSTGALPLPNGEILPLAADPILDITLGQANSVFIGFAGVLDASGEASAGFAAPSLPTLIGLDLFISGLTVQSTPSFDWGVTMPWYRLRIE